MIPEPVSSYDWETDTHTYHVPAMDPAQIWRSAATKARQALPERSTRIDKAIELVLNNAVELLDGGKARVTSRHNGTTAYYVVNGTCECADFPKAPQQQCKHRLERGLAVRAREIAKELGQAASPVTLVPEDLAGDLDTELVPATPPVSMPSSSW